MDYEVDQDRVTEEARDALLMLEGVAMGPFHTGFYRTQQTLVRTGNYRPTRAQLGILEGMLDEYLIDPPKGAEGQ
jgi:hypothetical protein